MDINKEALRIKKAVSKVLKEEKGRFNKNNMAAPDLYQQWIDVKKSKDKQKRKNFFIKTREIHKKKCLCNISLVLDVWFHKYFRNKGML